MSTTPDPDGATAGASPRQLRLPKLATAVACFAFALGVAGTAVTERLFPTVPGGMLVAAAALLLAALWSDRRVVPYLLLVAVPLAVGYRSFVLLFPEALIGYDPDWLATSARRVVETGSRGIIGSYFYTDASLFHVLGAQFKMATGLSMVDAMVVYPIVIGGLATLGVAALADHFASGMPGGRRAGALAAILATVATTSVLLSYQPLPNSIAAAFWLVICLTILRHAWSRSWESILLFLLFATAQVYTHKLGLFIVGGVLLVVAVVESVLPTDSPLSGFWSSTRARNVGSSLFLLAVITGSLLAVQWFVVTQYGIGVALESASWLTPTETLVPGSTFTATAAVVSNEGLINVLVRNAHWFLLLPASGIAWLYLLYLRRGDVGTRLGLQLSAAIVAVLAATIVLPVPAGVRRVLLFGEPLLVALVAVAVGVGIAIAARRSDATARQALVAIALCLLVTAQLFSGLSAVPDFTDRSRQYLTETEVEAKSFGYQYVPGSIYTDSYYRVTMIPEVIESGDPGVLPRTYGTADAALLNGTLATAGYQYVLYRSGVEVFNTRYGHYRLTWRPERSLSRSYHRVYATRGVELYRNASSPA